MHVLEQTLAERLREAAHPLTDKKQDYRPLLSLIGDARFVLLGEATHGTHEFYRDRAQITQHLIAEKGFNAVAIEGDWPDAYRVNRFVRHEGDDHEAIEALAGFKRFPQWMWRNAEVLEFVEWLRLHNDRMGGNHYKAGFYGLDLYSMYASKEAVLSYLDKIDPSAAHRARDRYACFEHFGKDEQAYGYALHAGLALSCENEAVSQLVELRLRAADLASRDGRLPPDAHFIAEQNARLVKNAEEYYRTMIGGRVSSWNLRDRHMVETLDALDTHLSNRVGRRAKIVVWEHNSHLGDARATEIGAQGELNVGQLVRERYRHEAALIGFSTYTGTVTAASNWGGHAERKHVRPALPNSYEALFHETGLPRFFINLRHAKKSIPEFHQDHLERAIGVIYRPGTERVSHYFRARLADQFDGVIHIDKTSAVVPLEQGAEWGGGEIPETFPSGV